MGKGRRNRAKRTGIGTDFLPHSQEVLTRNFQKAIRDSEIWPQMVAQFGEKQTEALLKQCKGELRQGLPPDEAGNDPEDF